MRRICMLAAMLAALVAVPVIARADCAPLAVGCPSPSPTPTPTPTPTRGSGSQSASADSTELEQQFFNLVNRERTRRGLSRLSYHAKLTEVARRHSADMAASGNLHHNTDELGSAEFRRQMGNPEMVGENVGEGPSVDWLHKAFMDSAGHRSNILESRYTAMGIGVTVKDGVVWVTQDFIRGGSVRNVSKTFPRRRAVPVVARPPARNLPGARPRSVAPQVAAAPARPIAPKISALKLPPIPAPIPQEPEPLQSRPLLPLAVLATLSAVGFASRRDASAWI